MADKEVSVPHDQTLNPSEKPPATGPLPQGFIPPNFSRDAYAGTAGYYVKYRAPYPDPLIADLVGHIARRGRLLDLACGPGRVALALAPYFGEIVAVDLEPEMIEAGRHEARLRAMTHISWMHGRAEEMEFHADSFDCVSIGEAFHRLDQPRVAAQTFRWVRPGGSLVTLGSFSILSEREPWQRIVVEIVRRWTARLSENRHAPPARKVWGGPEDNEAAMRAAGFCDVASYRFTVPHDWEIDSVLGYLYSTSVASKRILGARAGAFEADLRAALLAHNPSGNYHEKTDWGYTIGRKPA